MQDVVGTQAVEVVRGLPRSRGVLQRPLRPADQGADRHAGGAGRPGLHVVPFDHPRAQLDGAGRLRRSSIRRCTISPPASSRCCGGCTTRCCTSRPQPHRDTFIKPFHREQTAEFCSSCHKVHLDVPVNGYRWFRGFNDYDNWQASGVSGQGARSFYYPADAAEVRRLPHAAGRLERSGGEERQGAVAPLPRREHRAAVRQPRRGAAEGGAGLPARRPDLGRRVRHHARGGVPTAPDVRVGVGGGEPQLSSTFAVGEESGAVRRGARRVVDAAGRGARRRSTRCRSTVRRGESVRVEVVVRTRKVGHFFPGGTVDAFDVWVELEAVDDKRPGPAAQRRGRPTTARARSSRARTSIAACSSTSTATRSTSATPG